MADDLDDLLRRAMKTLDDQVPAGYFDALPERVQARLGDDMQSSQSSDPDRKTGARDEDSGLHDIRSLASETRQRMSSKRSSQNPIVTDDELLASSSAGWKAVALPEPAKMISLPELATKADAPVERTSKPKLDRASKPKLEAVAAVDAAAPIAAGSTSIPVTAKVARPKQGGGRGAIYAAAASAVALAAGAVVFLSTRKHSDAVDGADRARASESLAVPSAAPAAEPPPPPAPAQIAADTAPDAAAVADPTGAAGSASNSSAGSAAVAEVPVAPAPENRPAKGEGGKAPSKIKGPGKRVEPVQTEQKPPPTKPDASSMTKKPVKEAPAEPSLDDLLKDAGDDSKKEPAKPKLDKKSLSGDDMKKGMQAVSAKAQSCYAGTQGTANVKLVVSPSGKVQKVTVTGPFAGTAVGNCVEAAVKGASFPPWDGPPQSFGFSYLLSE